MWCVDLCVCVCVLCVCVSACVCVLLHVLRARWVLCDIAYTLATIVAVTGAGFHVGVTLCQILSKETLKEGKLVV